MNATILRVTLTSSVTFIAALTAPTLAGTGTELLLIPFEDGTSVDGNAGASVAAQAHTDRPGGHLTLDIFSSEARWQVLPDNPAKPVVGHDITYINLDTNDPRLPKRLIDESVGFGMGVAKAGNWEFGFTVGLGYSGINPYADDNAFYGKASALAGYTLNAHEHLVFYLQYDGNDTLFPDVPVPGVAYTNDANPNLTYMLGLPYSSVSWKPLPQVTLEADYQLPVMFNASLHYDFLKHWDLFLAYHDVEAAFRMDRGDDRYFFLQQQLELGVSYSPIRQLELLAAVGYSFDTKFEQGFSDRSLNTIANVSDAPYVRLAVTWQF